MNKMKALVKARPEKGLWMEEVPVPEPGLNDVIIKVKKSAICGTDLHIYEWDPWSQRTIKTPMIIGHEYMGYIEKMGAGVTNLKTGRKSDRRRPSCLRSLPQLPEGKGTCL